MRPIALQCLPKTGGGHHLLPGPRARFGLRARSPRPDPANPYTQSGTGTLACRRFEPPRDWLSFSASSREWEQFITANILRAWCTHSCSDLLITIIDNTPGASQPLIAILLAAFVFYMPFEAYHTAKKREMGLAPDEWSSILPKSRHLGRAPVGPIVLIAIGVLYLLNSFDLVDFRQIGRFWPVILIVVGAYMLYSRVTTANATPPANGQPYVGSARRGTRPE